MGIGSFLLHQHAKIGDLGSLKLQLEEADFLETGETLDSRWVGGWRRGL